MKQNNETVKHNVSPLYSMYKEKGVAELQKELGLKNRMLVPRLKKIVLNIGIKSLHNDSKHVRVVADILSSIAGQKAVLTKARKSIAGFKIREGAICGVMVTLRNAAMYDFLYRFINIVLPMIRDFKGVSKSFDKRGNYNLGLKEWIAFPEVDYDSASRMHGMNITIETSATNDKEAYALLKYMGMPFVKDNRKY